MELAEEAGMSAVKNGEPLLVSTCQYEIRIRGDVHPGSGWFDGMTVTPLDGNETLIAGPVVDQAALHGLLIRIRDLNLPLLSVRQVVPDTLGDCNEKTMGRG
jgi:hypothetical protein